MRRRGVREKVEVQRLGVIVVCLAAGVGHHDFTEHQQVSVGLTVCVLHQCCPEVCPLM